MSREKRIIRPAKPQTEQHVTKRIKRTRPAPVQTNPDLVPKRKRIVRPYRERPIDDEQPQLHATKRFRRTRLACCIGEKKDYRIWVITMRCLQDLLNSIEMPGVSYDIPTRGIIIYSDPACLKVVYYRQATNPTGSKTISVTDTTDWLRRQDCVRFELQPISCPDTETTGRRFQFVLVTDEREHWTVFKEDHLWTSVIQTNPDWQRPTAPLAAA